MPIITQKEAYKKAGVTKQQMFNLKKSGTYNFFVEQMNKAGTKAKTMVDTDHPHWKAYLAEREGKETKSAIIKNRNELGKQSEKKKVVAKPDKKVVVKKKAKKAGRVVSDDELLKNEHSLQKNALTGGYDPTGMIPTTPSHLKALTEIQEKQINMRVRLNELIEIEMVISIIEALGRNMDNFVNISRMVSGKICQKLDRVGFEKEIEKIINPVTEKLIKITKKTMADSIDIESFND